MGNSEAVRQHLTFLPTEPCLVGYRVFDVPTDSYIYVLLNANKTEKQVSLPAGAYNVLCYDGVIAVSYTHLDVYKRQDVPKLNRGDVVVYNLDQAFMPMPHTKVAGTLVPVFSLRSKGSFGVGDFGDLKAMIDFVEATGQHALQLLPINDTTCLLYTSRCV